jgi:hypothetical protein
MSWKPVSHVYFGNFCVLLDEDRADRTADPLRQPRIRLTPIKETPRIASPRNHLANIEAARRDEEDSGRLIRAPLRQQAQNATLNR